MNNLLKKVVVLICFVSLLVSACSTASVEPPQFEAVNISTGEGVSPGSDAGGETYIRSEFPGEGKMRELIACQMSAIHSNMTGEDVNITFGETGITKPAKVFGCGNGDPSSGVLVSASMLAAAPAETTVLAYVVVIGVGIYAFVSAVAYFEANNISFSLSPGAAYTPAPLPTFASFNTGAVEPYTSYITPSFTFNTFGELASTVETVYVYEGTPSEQSELLGVIAFRQTVLYVTTTNQNRATYWTMPVMDWYEICSYARMAATADAGVATFPPIEWPKWDPDTSGWQHAANSRNWPILGIMLAYEAIVHTADQVYFSPTLGYLLITTYDPFVGTIGSIFTAANDVLEAKGGSIIPGNPVTIIFPMRNLEAKRYRGCFSWQIWSVFQYNSQYDPAPVGSGKCLEIGPDGTAAFNQ